MGPHRNWQKNQSTFTDLYFVTGNSHNFEKEYKITVVDKTLVNNTGISKTQEIPYQNERVIMFFIKCSQ